MFPRDVKSEGCVALVFLLLSWCVPSHASIVTLQERSESLNSDKLPTVANGKLLPIVASHKVTPQGSHATTHRLRIMYKCYNKERV